MSDEPHWDEAACRRYSEGMRKLAPYDHRGVATRIARRLGDLGPNASVIDLASGPGFLSFELARLLPEPKLVLVDSAQPMLRIARAEAEQQALQVRTVQSLAERVELPSGSARVVVCKNLMNCIDPNLRLNVVREMMRLLSDGGHAFVIDFDAHGSRMAASLISLLTRLLAGAEFSRDFRKAFERRLDPGSLAAAFEAENCAVTIERFGPTFLLAAQKR